MLNDQEPIKAGKHLCIFFIFNVFVSFFYSIYTGTLNGDFLGVQVKLPFWLLTVNFILSILPFIIVWKIYLHYKKKDSNRKISIPLKFFQFFLIFLIFWNIWVTILFGVGVMAAPPYEAPSFIKPVIQIMNRFNYSYGAFIYILAVPKKDRFQILLVVLLLILAYLRAGLGIFLYLAMLFYIKYFQEIWGFIKKNKIAVITFIVFFPMLFSSLYNLRSNLRGKEGMEVSSDILTGVLAGRLSSFSDSAFILQEAPFFFIEAQNFDSFYFPKQALGVISKDFLPPNRPELLLFKFYYENLDDNIAYMAGTQGIMYFSIFKSPLVLLISVCTVFLYIFLTFYFFRLLRFNFSNELALLLLLYVLMSGVSGEFALLVFSVFVFNVLFLVVNFFRDIKKE